MPHLVKMQNELRNSGFVVIGNHVQNVEKKKVVGLVRQLKVNFMITSRGNVNVAGKGNGIPRAFLFDSNGQLVEKGHPMSMVKAIHDLVKKSPHPLAAGREYKKLARVAYSLKSAKSYGKIIKKLEKAAQKEGEAKEEADYLLERIVGYGNSLLEKAEKLEEEDAFKSKVVYAEVATKFKGNDIGKKAVARVKELKKDKDFQAELKASTMVHQIRGQFDKLVYKKGELQEGGPNKKLTTGILVLFKRLQKKYPESAAVGSLEEELKEIGIQ